MTLIASFVTVLAALASPVAGASTPEPAALFDKYPARIEIRSRPVSVKIASAKDRRYASILREAASAKPDFAGHYILASWGCGASCVVSAAIDVKNGSVHWFPATVCCWRLKIIEPLEYKLSSRLLIVHGKLNETGNDDDRCYEFVDGKFRSLQRLLERMLSELRLSTSALMLPGSLPEPSCRWPVTVR